MLERTETLLAEVRQLSEVSHTPGAECFSAFKSLTAKILAITVVHRGNNVSLADLDERQGRMQLVSGKRSDPKAPLRLNKGYLTLLMSLDNRGDEGFLRTLQAKVQYQTTPNKRDWVFRYDFLRVPEDDYPAAHLQINGDLAVVEDAPQRLLPDIHFPVGRTSLEAMIRLLVEQFDVGTNEPEAIWRPVLSLSEELFLKAAHQPLSGPR